MAEEIKETTTQDAPDFNVIWHNFANAARRLLWLAVVVGLLVGAYAFYSAEKSFVPKYRSEAVFFVHANYADTTDITSTSAYMNQSAAKSLASTFYYVVSSEHSRMLLQRELGGPVNGTITAFSTADSALFTMRVTSTDAQDSYDILLATIKVYPQVAGSVLGDTAINVIVLPTQAPTEPINSSGALKSALIAFAITFLLCLLGIFLLSMTRKTVHSSEDLRKVLNLKCLGYVPSVHLKKHSNQSSLHVTITNPRVSSIFGESMRSLSLKVQKLMGEGKVLLVTSTLPDEGKTTISTNLALSLSKAGKRTILIDGDLRKQSLKGSLGINESSEGLVEILSGSSKDFHLLSVPDSKLVLLSGDKTIDRPQPLLDSAQFAQVIDMLRQKLDYIIIDSPPAAFLADAVTIAKYADATLYVVRQDHANSSQIVDSIHSLSGSGTNLIGCVLNQTQAGTTRYGYGSKYGGGYGYGYSYGYKYASSYYGKGHYHKSTADDLTEQINDITQNVEEAPPASDAPNPQ